MTRNEMRTAIGACAHDHIVLAVDLRRLGMTGKHVQIAVHHGELKRETTGIYATPDAPDDDLHRGRVALAHAGRGAVLTGLFAAKALGLRWVPEPTRIHTLVPPERRRATTEGWVLVRRCAWLAHLETQWIDGVPFAPVSQVVVDASRELNDLRSVRGVVQGAIADGRCTVEEIRTVLGRSGVAGTALVRRACVDAERGAASPPEAEAADAMIGRGVPFYVNCEVYVDGVLLGVCDLWLVGTGTGGELDSREWHEEADLLDATLARDKRYSRAGLSLEHITPTAFRADPEGFVGRLLAEAARRRDLGLPEPAGLVLVPRGPLLS